MLVGHSAKNFGPCTTRSPRVAAGRPSPVVSSPPRADEPKEVRTLYKRFRRLDRSGKGTISVDDLLMIPEVVMNPLAQRLVHMFDRDAEDRINFRAFVMGLSVFNEKATAEARIGSECGPASSAGGVWSPQKVRPRDLPRTRRVAQCSTRCPAWASSGGR